MKLLDTSVLVDIDHGEVDEQVAKLDNEGRHAISVVSVTELHLGIHRQYERGTSNYDEAIVALERLCSRFEVLDTTRAVAVRAAEVIAELRERGEPLDDLHDVYIAATAHAEQLPVLTANVDHFDRIDAVRVLDWSEF